MVRGSKEVRKIAVDFRINDGTILETGKPVDFSFKRYRRLSSVEIEGARQSRIGQLPDKANSQKFLTRAVWLNNNKLNDIKNMNMFVESVLEVPQELAWIDFSFNYIKTIEDIVLNYKNLKIIYFHGNLIDNLDEIEKLRPLKELRSVTFHGNPIAKHPNYRLYVISMLPQVVNLDFTPILKSERLQPSPPEALQRLSKELGFDDEDDPDENWVKYIKEKRRDQALKKLEDIIDEEDINLDNIKLEEEEDEKDDDKKNE